VRPVDHAEPAVSVAKGIVCQGFNGITRSSSSAPVAIHLARTCVPVR
jgi:hypothetical protein